MIMTEENDSRKLNMIDTKSHLDIKSFLIMTSMLLYTDVKGQSLFHLWWVEMDFPLNASIPPHLI